MSDNNINSMKFKQLRNEVQLLRDELAIFKRKYEDIIYNLDDDNFSGQFLKEKDGMKTAIEVNAEGIKTKVSSGDFESYKTQTADTITSEVKKLTDADETLSSKITQTANSIESTVKSVVTDTYITDKLGNTYLTDATFRSNLTQDAYGIYSTVSSTYETKSNANTQYSALNQSISTVRQTANGITSRVESIEGGEFGEYTLFEQTSGKFKFTGNVEISGNCVSGGTISGSELTDSTGDYKIRMVDDPGWGYGTFCLFNEYYGSVPYFSIYDTSLGSIGLRCCGTYTFLSADTSTLTSKPRGTWDFSDCDDVIIPSGTISATARFG